MLNITKKEFSQLSGYIQENYGIYLKEEKQTLVSSRLSNVLLEHNFNTFSEYFDFIKSDKSGDAAIVLINKITTNHTYFMREASHFTYLKDVVLPDITQKIKNNDLRIWSAGCSSGEEPYTLAMIVDDFFGENKKLWDSKVLATDISSNVLEIAQKGIYTKEHTETLPKMWKMKYFVNHTNDSVIVNDNIKREVLFRKFNLMDTFPFKKKFHVIFCRNVMIYFDNTTRRELVDKYYDFLEPGGFLFIGHSESLNREETKLKYILPAVYRKI